MNTTQYTQARPHPLRERVVARHIQALYECPDCGVNDNAAKTCGAPCYVCGSTRPQLSLLKGRIN